MTRKLFSDTDAERIYDAARRILGEMGMRIENRTCLEALERFGAKVNYVKKRALMPAETVDRMFEIVRDDYKGWSRGTYKFGGEGFCIGGGGANMFYYDEESGERRRATERDYIDVLKIVEASPTTYASPILIPGGYSPQYEPVRIIQLAMETFGKTNLTPTDILDVRSVPYLAELGQLHKGDPCYFLNNIL